VIKLEEGKIIDDFWRVRAIYTIMNNSKDVGYRFVICKIFIYIYRKIPSPPGYVPRSRLLFPCIINSFFENSV
jgi:hypothetical protein